MRPIVFAKKFVANYRYRFYDDETDRLSRNVDKQPQPYAS